MNSAVYSRMPNSTGRASRRVCTHAMQTLVAPPRVREETFPALRHCDEIDDDLTGLEDRDGLMSVVGFGSLLSERSSRFTFPELQNFRLARIRGFRRVFAHITPYFFKAGIARQETMEMASLSVEQGTPDDSIVVAVFETPKTPDAVAAWLKRECEYRFLAVRPETLHGFPEERLAVVCHAFSSDEEYKQRRCPPDTFENLYGRYGIDRVWRSDVLPCRTYLRHCALAAAALSPEAHESFLDHTYLADRHTTIRQHLAANPDILEEPTPPELQERYCGC